MFLCFIKSGSFFIFAKYKLGRKKETIRCIMDHSGKHTRRLRRRKSPEGIGAYLLYQSSYFRQGPYISSEVCNFSKSDLLFICQEHPPRGWLIIHPKPFSSRRECWSEKSCRILCEISLAIETYIFLSSK